MKRSFGVMVLLLALTSCRAYDLESRLTDQGGLLPPDQFARYGREQAQAIAIAREFARVGNGSSPRALEGRAERAMSYARSLPDVTDVQADPLGYRLEIRFRSGWLTMVTPIDDGRSAGETPGLPAGAVGGAAR
jgi:hypothetical protein